MELDEDEMKLELVSIPHGGLGTTCSEPPTTSYTSISIPHGGLRTNYVFFYREKDELSPSHTVGSELSLTRHIDLVIPKRLHPTRWARNWVRAFEIADEI